MITSTGATGKSPAYSPASSTTAASLASESVEKEMEKEVYNYKDDIVRMRRRQFLRKRTGTTADEKLLFLECCKVR